MSITYNPYNWKIKSKKDIAEENYEKNFIKIHKKYEELRILKQKVRELTNEIADLEAKSFNIIMDDDITYDFLLSRIK